MSNICPLIGQCEQRVTESFFTSVCQQNYQRCKRYAEVKNNLKRPIEWLIQAAVHTDSYTSSEGKWEW